MGEVRKLGVDDLHYGADTTSVGGVTIKGLQPIDVRSYGATGDGTTDDLSAIQAAINAAISLGGGLVYLPNGDYLISERLILGSNIRVVGDGIGATTITNNATTYPENISFDWVGEKGGSYPINSQTEYGNTVTTTTASHAGNFSAGDWIGVAGDLIDTDPVPFFLTKVVSAVAATGVITLEDRITRADFTVVYAMNTVYENVGVSNLTITESGDVGIHAQYCRNVYIDNVECLPDVTAAGVAVTASRNAHIRNSIFYANPIGFHSVVGGSIVGCEIRDMEKRGTGVAVSLEGGTEGIQFVGNLITDTFNHGVYVNLWSKGNAIVGNSILNVSSSGYGIYVEGTSLGHGGNTISGNIISGPGNAVGGAGITIGVTSDDNVISGNFIRNIDLGIYIGEGTNDGNMIFGNRVLNTRVPYSYFGTTAYSGGYVLSGKKVYDRVVTFTANDATPNVSFGSVFYTANTSSTTITNFDGATVGQEILVIINDANTTIDFTGTTLKGNGGADLTAGTSDTLRCFYDGYNWYCTVSTAS